MSGYSMADMDEAYKKVFRPWLEETEKLEKMVEHLETTDLDSYQIKIVEEIKSNINSRKSILKANLR